MCEKVFAALRQLDILYFRLFKNILNNMCFLTQFFITFIDFSQIEIIIL